MKKKDSFWVALDLVFLIVFNAVFFIAGGTTHTASVWVSYAFIHFAYLMVLVTPLLIRKSSSAAVFGFSINTISSVYLLVELVVGIVFIFLKQDSYKPALIVQIVIAGVYAIILLSHLIANESTANSVARHEQEVAFIKESSFRVKMLVGKMPNKNTNRKIEMLYDLLHSSPSKTDSSTYDYEVNIMNLLSELETAVFSQDEDMVVSLTDKIIKIVETRNCQLRQLH